MAEQSAVGKSDLEAPRSAGRAMTFALIAAPSIPIAAMNLPMQVFLPPYYADRTGMSLAAIGFAFMIVRLADIVFDPILGVAIDRTKSTLGRYRPWMLLGIPVVMIGVWLAFFPPSDAGIPYLIAALVFILAGHSLVLVSQYSWAAGLAHDGDERARVYGWIQAATVLGMLLTLCLMPVIKLYLPNIEDLVVPLSGAFILASVPITVLLAVFLVKEPVQAEAVHRPSIGKSILDYWILLGRKPVLSVMASTMFFAMASGVTGAFYVFFAKAKGFTAEQGSMLLLAYFFAAFLAARIWAPISQRYGKRSVLAGLCICSALIQLMALFLPQGAMNWAIAGQFVLGIGYSGVLVLQRAIVGDVANQARRDIDEDVVAHLFALYTSITKMSVAISAGLAFVALQAIGFAAKAGVTNAPATVRSMELGFILFPALFIAAAGISVYLRNTSPNPSGAHLPDAR